MKAVNWGEKERAKLENSVLVSFLPTWHKLELSEKRKHQLRRDFHKIQLFSVFLTCTWWRKTCQLWVVSHLIVLCFIRKQAEQTMEKKAVRSTPPWSLYQLWTPGSCPVWVPEVLFSLALYCSLFPAISLPFSISLVLKLKVWATTA